MYNNLVSEYEDFIKKYSQLVNQLKLNALATEDNLNNDKLVAANKEYINKLVNECNQISDQEQTRNKKNYFIKAIGLILIFIVSYILIEFNIVNYREYSLDQVMMGIPNEHLRLKIVPVIITVLILSLFYVITYHVCSVILQSKMKSVFNQLLKENVSLNNEKLQLSTFIEFSKESKELINIIESDRINLRTKILYFLNDESNASDNRIRKGLIEILIKLDMAKF